MATHVSTRTPIDKSFDGNPALSMFVAESVLFRRPRYVVIFAKILEGKFFESQLDVQ